MSKTKHNILFLYDGNPLPAMLEMISCAKSAGLSPLLVLLDRGDQQLIIDTSLLGYEVIRIDVDFKGVEFKRLFSMPGIYQKIRKVVSRDLKPDGTIVTSSLDMLFITRLVAMFHGYKIIHQVRDLHALQLGKGVVSNALRFFEKMLLQRVSRVVVSSLKFATEYYQKLYSGEIVLLENVPQESVWTGFKRQSRGGGEFVIGYIGILRYKKSVYKLIETVERLVNEGLNIKVVFAGGRVGSNLSDIQERIDIQAAFEFSGPYEYSKDIQRLYRDLDLIYAVYDESDRNCQIAMPNKFYESILSKIPLLVAANTFVGEQTLQYGIGEVVSLNEIDDLYNLLRAAANRSSWYREASDNLQAMSPEKMYAQYQQALSESIL